MMKNSYFHLALLIGLICIVLPTSAMTWYVDDGGKAEFTTIQAAVSNASSGDTICVLSGTYSCFSVSKPYLTIQAIETDGPVIIDSSSGEVCIPLGTHQDATGTTIDGFTFYCNGNDNGCDPIHLGVYGPANDSIIRNCTFEGLTLSVCVNAHNVTVENNIFANSGTPSRLIHSLSTGQYVIPDVSINIVNNTFTNVSSKYGHIALMDTTGNCNIINNTFSNVSVTKYGLISPKNTSGTITIAGNTFDSTEGHTFYFRDAGEDNRIYLNNNVSSVALHAGSTAPVNISWNSTAPVTYTYDSVEHTGFVGNFWSSYTATDDDNDGILDTPHVLPDGLGTDHAPLAGAWENGVIVAGPAPATPSDVTITSPTPGSTCEIGLPVQFSATASGTNLTYTWDFGTGNSVTGQNVTYTYSKAGNYTINLTVSNEHGSTLASTEISATKPEPIVFNTSVTVYADESIVIDNTTYDGNTFFNILAAAGYTYTYGDSDSGYSDRKPLLTLTIDNVTYPTRDFDADYKWRFYDSIGTDNAYKFKKSLNGYISESGTYYIWYGDTSQFGGWDLPAVNNSIYVVELNVKLLPTRPSEDGAPSGVKITSPLSNSSYAVGASVHLAATATGDNLAYTWDLGNGDTVTGQDTSYVYPVAGNYTITLTVANDAGSASASTWITILDSEIPYIVLYQGTVTITNGSTIMAAISPRSGGYTPGEDYVEIPATSVGGMLNASGFIFDMWKSQKPIPTYSLMDITTPEGVCYPNVQNATADLAWRSFDGMTAAATRYDPDVTLANGTTIYTVYGDYNVIKSDPSGAQYVIITTLNIVEPDPSKVPVANFASNVTGGDAPLAVAFTDLSTNVPASWSWVFGDGATSTEQNPTHTYTTAGTYTVTLTVTNTNGSDSATKTITVTGSGGEEQNILTLYRGWNFVSTPKRLADDANTFAIFNGLDTAAHAILLYDGLDYTWRAMDPTDAFRPLDGIWIYANETYTIPLEFARLDGSEDAPMPPPTKDLGKGWNAIGFSDTVPETAASTLLSLGDHWATLIGFSAETQRYEDAIIRNTPESRTQTMQPMQGYWIYVTQADTLGAISA
jgi:PKD repeat protein